MSSRYLMDMQPLVNEYDCHSWTYLPLSSVLLATIYNDLCLLFIAYSGASIRNVERDIVQEDTLILKHDWNNTMYCYNVYYTL